MTRQRVQVRPRRRDRVEEPAPEALPTETLSDTSEAARLLDTIDEILEES